MEIRRPTDQEIHTIISLSPQAVYDGTLGSARPTTEKSEQLIRSLLIKGRYYLVAVDKGNIIGWILVGTSTDLFTNSKHGFIYELFVIKAFRGKGVGKQLMTTAIAQLREERHTEVRLSAFLGNDAIKLYEKMGFTIRTVSMSLPL
ncbi:GNAT family N-acetyltransferase [Bacillus sp. C1-1]|nr:GNAT family N-acetyltransferase [Bacillus sp. C1-1]